MTEILNYKSRLGDPDSRKFETFSYLPPMDRDRVREQVAYIISKGWSPAIEHTEPANAFGHYWYMWKLPMFGETDVDKVLAEADACQEANPGDYVRLIGYDNSSQSQGAAFVVFRGSG